MNSPRTFSGTPYFVLTEGRRAGLAAQGLSVPNSGRERRVRQAVWMLTQVARGRRPFGFQYSKTALEFQWGRHVERLRGSRLLHVSQTIAPSVLEVPGLRLFVFCDFTLRQLFEGYVSPDALSARVVRQVLDLERRVYSTAAGVMMCSDWACRSVIHDYGIPPEKVWRVRPGANIPTESHAAWERRRSPDEHLERLSRRVEPDELPLVFVGVSARRKGLDRLLDAIELARPRGFRGRLRIIGARPEDFPERQRALPGVEWLGFISKQTEMDRFLDTLGEAHVGCLLSRAEAAGISIREFGCLGLAVILPLVGGSPELADPSWSVGVRSDDGPEEIAELLLRLQEDPERLAEMRRAAWAQRHELLWEPAMRRMREIMERDRAGGAESPSGQDAGVLERVP